MKNMGKTSPLDSLRNSLVRHMLFRRTPWYSMAGSPRYSVVLHGIMWHSIVFHDLLWHSVFFHGSQKVLWKIINFKNDETQSILFDSWLLARHIHRFLSLPICYTVVLGYTGGVARLVSTKASSPITTSIRSGCDWVQLYAMHLLPPSSRSTGDASAPGGIVNKLAEICARKQLLIHVLLRWPFLGGSTRRFPEYLSPPLGEVKSVVGEVKLCENNYMEW